MDETNFLKNLRCLVTLFILAGISLIPQLIDLATVNNDFNTVVESLVIIVLIEIVCILKLFAMWYYNKGMHCCFKTYIFEK